MKKTIRNTIAVAGGLLLVITGLVLLKLVDAPEGIMLALPYLCIGIGCGAFGYGVGEMISRRVMKNNPEIQKQLEIEQTDERNVAVTNRAKAKAYDLMTFVFGALLLCFALMGVELAAVLLLVFAYLFVTGSWIYYRWKYEKEM